MYDTSPLPPFKGETKPFLHVGLDTKTLESLFDLHPSFETSLDFSDYVTGVSHSVTGGGGGGGVVVAAASPPGIPDSAVVTSPVASSPADFPTVTLSSAATSQHLAEIERQQTAGTPAGASGIASISSSNNSSISSSSSSSIVAPGHPHPPHHHHPHTHHHQHQHHQHHHQHSGAASTTTTHFLSQPVQQQMSPGPSVPSTPSPVSHPHPPHPLSHHPHPHPQQHPHHPHHHQQQQPLQGYPQPVLSPSLSVDDVSQAFSDDSCVFMPEYEQLAPASVTGLTAGAGGGSGGGAGGVVVSTCSSGVGGLVGEQWGASDPFYSTVKTEDMGLASLTACSLEANLPGFTTATITTSTTSPSSSGATKMEFESALGGLAGAHYSGALTVSVSPSHSMRTLSESSTGTTSTLPDSPGGSRGSPRGRGASTSTGLGKGGSKRRQVPKGSEEYKEKRARNNVAVRKSRAKAKEKQKMTETRVKELTEQNETLQKKVDMLTKELTVLRRLFVDVGTPLPDDLSKLLPQS